MNPKQKRRKGEAFFACHRWNRSRAMHPNPAKSGVSRVLVDEQALRDRSPSLFQFNEKLLQDPNRLYQFKKFVEQEYADEHLSFYLVRKKKCVPCDRPCCPVSGSWEGAGQVVVSRCAHFCFAFQKEVSQWRQLSSEAARRQRADEILTLYVRPGAEKQINIEERHLKVESCGEPAL